MRNPNYKGRNTFFEVSPGSRTLLFQELEYKFNFRKFYSNTKIKSITFKKRDKTVLHECTLPGTGIIYKRSTVIQKRPSFLTVQNLVEKALFHFHTYPYTVEVFIANSTVWFKISSLRISFYAKFFFHFSLTAMTEKQF